MSTWISLSNAVAVTIFGSILSAAFCNALRTKRNQLILLCYIVASLLLQGWGYCVWGVNFLRKGYPLLIHFPLMLVLYGQTKKLFWSIFSVLSAYLCCQLRRWLALVVTALASGGAMLQETVELIVTLPILFVLLRFVSPVIWQLTNNSSKLRLHFGIIPAIYYIFDYLTVVYTDLLISGKAVIVEFMPSVCCIFYLVFLLYHASAEQKHSQLQQAQNSLDIQLKQSVREINALRESQVLARQYRHDLRHHLQFVSACIENGQNAQAQAYILGICQEIAAQKVQCYCENEAANLILSAFDARAKQANIVMNIHGALPASMNLPDSDLCVLLSNALENALHACQSLSAAGTECSIDVQFYKQNSKFFLQVTNPCAEEIRFEDGIPVSDRPEHGIGVQSICAIVHRYGGVYTFLIQDGNFILRLSV